MLTDDCLAGPDDSGAKMASSAASQLGPGVRLVKLRTQLAPLACLVRWLADQPASAKADLLVLGSHLACHAMVPDKMEPCVWDSTAINSVDAASIAPCPVILVRAQHGAGLSPTTPTAASAAGGARGERPCHDRTVLVALDGRMPDSDFITKWSIENLIQPSDKVRAACCPPQRVRQACTAMVASNPAFTAAPARWRRAHARSSSATRRPTRARRARRRSWPTAPRLCRSTPVATRSTVRSPPHAPPAFSWPLCAPCSLLSVLPFAARREAGVVGGRARRPGRPGGEHRCRRPPGADGARPLRRAGAAPPRARQRSVVPGPARRLYAVHRAVLGCGEVALLCGKSGSLAVLLLHAAMAAA